MASLQEIAESMKCPICGKLLMPCQTGAICEDGHGRVRIISSKEKSALRTIWKDRLKQAKNGGSP